MHTEYKISGISVYFPCKPYPSQFTMMDKIIKGLDRRQNCLLESPTGSGKSLALLCSSLAYQASEKEKRAKEEDEETLRSNCFCVCHSQEVAASGQLSPTNDPTQQEMFTNNSEIDGDFKDVGTKFNIPTLKRKHIQVAYDEQKPEDNRLDKILQTVDAILGGKKEDEKKVAPAQAECRECPCGSPEGKVKVKNKLSKIFFGTRTHKQVAQIVRELKKTKYHDVKMTILGSREHTCIHPDVARTKSKNDACKELLNGPGCRFKDATPRMQSQNAIKSMGLGTAWDIEDLVQLCHKKKACPYFLSRGLKDEADLIICPYNYLIDPIIREAMAISLKGHIVILDEAHNIEDAAREAASQSISQESIVKAMSDIDTLIEKNINFADNSRLRAVFHKLNKFIDENKDTMEQQDFDKAYKIWSAFEIVAQLDSLGLGLKHFPDLKAAFAAVKAEAEQRKEESFKTSMNVDLAEMKPATEGLLTQIFQVLEYMYRSDLRYVDDYRASLVQSYEYAYNNDNQWLNSKKANMRSRMTTLTYTLNFWCMNPGVAFSDFSETRSIILTSGTLSPMTSFQSELGMNFSIQLEANHVIKDSQVWVGTIGTGPTGNKLQAVFRNLETFTFQDELGGLVLRVCEVVPHGVLCFLPSYKVLEKLINRWENIGLMKKLAGKKKIIVEPRGSDKVDFEEQMLSFYETMKTSSRDNSDGETSVTGAVFFAVCRGKVSEGLDFADNFARAVITVGIPYPNYKDVQVEQKRKYNDSHRNSRGLLGGHQWYEIQAFRALNQALGRCIRHRNDWGALIIVDERFVQQPQKYCTGLSKWVRTKVQAHHNFAMAMDSLSQFIESRIKDDAESSVNVAGPESPNFSSQLTEIPSRFVDTGSKPMVSASQATKTALEKSNFSIFSMMKTPSKNNEAGRECVVDNGSWGNPSASKVSGGGCFTPSRKLAHLINKPQSSWAEKEAGLSKDTPIVIGNDNSLVKTFPSGFNHLQDMKKTFDDVSHSKEVTNPANLKRETTNELSLTPSYILEETSGASSRVQLKIITEKAVGGETAKVVEIPERLRCLFGGNLRLPISNKQILVYLVDPPASAGQRPTAKIAKMSEEDKKSLLAKAIAAETIVVEDEPCPVDDGVLLLSAAKPETNTDVQVPTINSTVFPSSPNQDVHPMSKFHVTTACKNAIAAPPPSPNVVTSTVSTCNSSSKMNIRKTSKKNSPGVDLTADNLKTSSFDLCCKSSSTVANTIPVTEHPPSPPFLKTPLARNRKRLFKPHTVSPPGGKGKEVEDDAQTPVKLGSMIESKPVTARASPLTSFLDDHDGENFEEETIVIRRKTKKRRSSLHNLHKKRSKQNGDDVPVSKEEVNICTVNSSSNVSFRCSHCQHFIFSNKATSDFDHQQSLPTFLKDSIKTSMDSTGCYFFPCITKPEGLTTKINSSQGLSSKYFEEDEICVQYLYCGQCGIHSPETATHVGALVQLSTGSRYSKGQMWLFHHSVQVTNQAVP